MSNAEILLVSMVVSVCLLITAVGSYSAGYSDARAACLESVTGVKPAGEGE